MVQNPRLDTIITELTETYESVQRSDLDIFEPLVDFTDDDIDRLVQNELKEYEKWLRAGFENARDYNDAFGALDEQ